MLKFNDNDVITILVQIVATPNPSHSPSHSCSDHSPSYSHCCHRCPPNCVTYSGL